MAIPIDKPFIEGLVKQYPTPFHIYDEAAIRQRAKDLTQAMQDAGLANFSNFFAVKALPNPHILEILSEEGMGADCSALAELELAQRAGITGDKIMFTSNDTPMEDFKRAQELGAIINFDDISQIQPFLDEVGVPAVACARYNPGDINFDDEHEFIIGKPSEAKYGMTKPQLLKAYQQLQDAGVKRFGLHTMLVSNERSWKALERTAELLFEVAQQLNSQGITLDFINLGGGIGVAYKPDDKPFELKRFAKAIAEAYKKAKLTKIGSPRIVMENGRYITAEAGYLVTQVNLIKDTYKKYVGVDATMANLMRPAMYGAYHHITVLGKEDRPPTENYDVVGSLCENNDKFAIDRPLPKIEIGDYLLIHTTGAHGHAMGFQYNGKLRSAELLLHPDHSVKLIRRAETLDDYFSTLV